MLRSTTGHARLKTLVSFVVGASLSLLLSTRGQASDATLAFQLLMNQARFNATDYRGGWEIASGVMREGGVRAVRGNRVQVPMGHAMNEGMIPFGHVHTGFKWNSGPSVELGELIHGNPWAAVNLSDNRYWHLLLSMEDFHVARATGPHVMYTTGSLRQTANGWEVVALTRGENPLGFLMQPMKNGVVAVIPMDGLRPILSETTYHRHEIDADGWIETNNPNEGPTASQARPRAAGLLRQHLARGYWRQFVPGTNRSHILSALPGVIGSVMGATGAPLSGLAVAAAGAGGMGAYSGYMNAGPRVNPNISALRGATAGLTGFGGGLLGSFAASEAARYLGAGAVGSEIAGHVGGGVGGYLATAGGSMLFMGESAAAAFGGFAAPIAAAGTVGGIVGTLAYNYSPVGGLADYLAAQFMEGTGIVPGGTYGTMRASEQRFWRWY